MTTLITICARGGSKEIPGKNIKNLNGIPLIAYTIQIAKKFAELNNGIVAVSTDDILIKKTAQKFGINSNYTRPDYLSTDSAGKIDTIKDLVTYQEKIDATTFDYILDLDVTSPLRTLEDLIQAFALLKADNEAINLFSVNNAARNPYFNMVEQKENGYYHLVKNAGDIMSRQSAPKVYDLNASFYFYKRSFFSGNLKTVFTKKALIYLMPHLCFDLDHIIDFEFLDFLLRSNKLDFQIWK
jgi:CMP-N,N'-diacetyllegionaminic acid synthase